jgi:hypothetical protein
MKFLSTLNTVSVVKLESDLGISPVRLLSPTLKTTSFDNCPRSAGMLPDRWFMLKFMA